MDIFDKRNKKLHTSSSLVLLITYYFEERTYYLFLPYSISNCIQRIKIYKIGI